MRTPGLQLATGRLDGSRGTLAQLSAMPVRSSIAKMLGPCFFPTKHAPTAVKGGSVCIGLARWTSLTAPRVCCAGNQGMDHHAWKFGVLVLKSQLGFQHTPSEVQTLLLTQCETLNPQQSTHESGSGAHLGTFGVSRAANNYGRARCFATMIFYFFNMSDSQ